MTIAACTLRRYLTAPAEQDPRFSIPTTSFSFGLSAAFLLGLTALLKVHTYPFHLHFMHVFLSPEQVKALNG